MADDFTPIPGLPCPTPVIDHHAAAEVFETAHPPLTTKQLANQSKNLRKKLNRQLRMQATARTIMGAATSSNAISGPITIAVTEPSTVAVAGPTLSVVPPFTIAALAPATEMPFKELRPHPVHGLPSSHPRDHFADSGKALPLAPVAAMLRADTNLPNGAAPSVENDHQVKSSRLSSVETGQHASSSPRKRKHTDTRHGDYIELMADHRWASAEAQGGAAAMKQKPGVEKTQVDFGEAWAAILRKQSSFYSASFDYKPSASDV